MKNIFRKMGALTLSTILMVGIMVSSAFAIDDGTYTVKTVTSYVNPDTGKTDDGGTGNSELGEGMCRSVIDEKAEIEQKNGKVTITMRMKLYSNLSNIRIATQESPNGKYNEVKYNVLKESSSTDSADIQFELPSTDAYVQTKMYVVPMGRDVCFYWKCDTSKAESSNGKLEEEKVTEKEQTAGDKFTDITNHWASDAIKAVVNKGLFSGTSEVTFSPDKEMTRGMFVTVLGRLSGENISGTATFTDVDNSVYYAPYIAWANKNGIVNGVSSTSFSPDTPVTCEQAAIILVKYAQYKNISLENKSISPSTTCVSEWAKENVIKAGKAGIITKQNTNGYDYTSPATRGDVASMINNFMTYYGK